MNTSKRKITIAGSDENGMVCGMFFGMNHATAQWLVEKFLGGKVRVECFNAIGRAAQDECSNGSWLAFL